ncbi:hypothetical protein RFM99_04555 [Mesorhizobium sp. VK4C]|uniref:hypothetical protein n=1 Tax=Mesorhizobium captivum TaxID=3072319 RepID=UPI002A2428E2|nr:hypothetical protein [Mesorhizobium sp. VK4C]MDX8497681.1 hypothetical protein [Mesorhizobium sp. VK4C]
MYILKGRKRNSLRWLVLAGFVFFVLVIVMDYLHIISAKVAIVSLNIYYIFSIAVIYGAFRGSDEKISSGLPWLLQNSPSRHALFFYLSYGSVALYALVERDFRSENIPPVGFLVIFLVAVFPDVLLFLRTKLDFGKAIYQRANRIGLWVLLLFLLLCVGAAMVAGQ